MEYREARAVLDRLPWLEVKPGLSRTGRLLDLLGHPERTFPAVHVAGTNGKGSVVAMLDAVLRRAGYRVGRFTSPELVDFRDRIAIDDRWLPETDWAAGVSRIRPSLDSVADRPTRFEAVTALAFDAFARQAIDIALVETGLGGRFDATNLVRPIVSVLCNVALDHCAVLGGSIEQIAWEKAGIAKRGVPLLIGEVPPQALAVVLAECAEVGAVPVDADRIDVQRTGGDWGSTTYRVVREGLPQTIELGLLAEYQRDNLQVALGVLELLREQGFAVSDAAIVGGLREARWPGRFEVVRRTPNVVLDGAHNVAGAKRLAEEVERLVPERGHRRLLLGILKDKDVDGIARSLAESVDCVTLCASTSPRALRAVQLQKRVGGLFLQSTWYDSVEGALERLVPSLSGRETLVIAGSLSVVAEARRWFGEDR